MLFAVIKQDGVGLKSGIRWLVKHNSIRQGVNPDTVVLTLNGLQFYS